MIGSNANKKSTLKLRNGRLAETPIPVDRHFIAMLQVFQVMGPTTTPYNLDKQYSRDHLYCSGE